jgi:hypothetical protein
VTIIDGSDVKKLIVDKVCHTELADRVDAIRNGGRIDG